MEISKVVQLDEANNKDYTPQLIKDLFGQKLAGCMWYNHLVQGKKEIGFQRRKKIHRRNHNETKKMVKTEPKALEGSALEHINEVLFARSFHDEDLL